MANEHPWPDSENVTSDDHDNQPNLSLLLAQARSRHELELFRQKEMQQERYAFLVGVVVIVCLTALIGWSLWLWLG